MKIPFSSDKNIIFYLMRHSSKSLAVCLLACLCFVPLNAQRKPDLYRKGWIDFNKNGVKDVYEDPHAPLDERVEDLLSQMTIEEKTCQLATLYGSGRVLRDSLPTEGWKDEIWKDGIANIDEQANGLGTFGSSISYPYANSVRNRQAIQRWFVEETRLGIPVDFTNEGIRGLCHDRATLFPSQSGQGATWNRELVRRIAEATAQEAVALGYTNIYSPILDVARDPRWGRVVECYGEDPYLVGELGKQTITALQAHGLVSTPKHFAVYSVPVGGRDEGTRTDPHVAPREMRTLLLEPFRKGIQEAGALGVMSSYNDYDGEPITGSYHFLTEILRQQWGFGGYVVSDSEAVEFLYNKHRVCATAEDAAAQVVNAGLNVRTNFTPPEDFILPLRKAIELGKISLQTIDTRVREVLRVKFMLGLFDNPYKGDVQGVDKVVHSEAHRQVAKQAALESLVLLKNDGLLPLSKGLGKVAVIGPNANEQAQLICRYGPANAPIKTVFQGIKEYLPGAQVSYAKGCDIIDRHFPESELYDLPLDAEEQAMIDEAVGVAQTADVAIVVLGGNEQTVREEFSRSDLDLMGRQEELLRAVQATGTPTVLVLLDGRAATINWADRYIPAIVHAWFPGEFTGEAVAEALFGDYNPGGKLAVTFPKSVGQIPYAFPFKPGADSKGKVRVDGALYPFGHGLSYTEFTYSDLKIVAPATGTEAPVQVSCRVKNTGSRAGDEVVQLYIRDDYSSVTTYVKNLRGFERIHLQPGESRTVDFTLTPRELGLWNRHDEFVVEPGTFSVMVGSSSEDIRLTGSFELKEPAPALPAGQPDLSLHIGSADEDWVFLTPQDVCLDVSLASIPTADLDVQVVCNITTDNFIPVTRLTYPIHAQRGRNARCEVRFAPPVPGFYRFTIHAEANGKRGPASKFNVGYEPERIVSLPDAKPDFEQFWRQTRAELDQVEPHYKLTLLEDQCSDIKNMYHVEMYSFGHVKIEGYYSVPKKPGKYPVIVAYMGYGVPPYFPDATAVPDFCEFVLSVRGQGIQRDRNPYGDWIVHGLDDKTSYYYRGAYMDLVRGIDFVASRPEVDADKIVVEGGSQGGAFTMVACALDKRIKGGAPHIPFLSDFRDYFGICPWPRSAFEGYLRNHTDKSWNDVYDLLTYFDVKNFAPYITCPIIMGVGLQDETCPPHTNFAGFNLTRGEREWHVYRDQKHGVGRSWWPVREAFFRRVTNVTGQ